jgi:branched-chain amino acid transport system permease protein
MQTLFKTSYDQDIDHLPFLSEKWRVLLMAALLVLAPFVLSSYLLNQLGMLLVYAIAGIGLMMLTGFTGQVSFGHGAFLAIGAYTCSVLMAKGMSFMFALPVTVLLSTAVGAALGRSASKMHGLYLAIATLAFAVLVETLLGQWETVTGGLEGMRVPALKLFGFDMSGSTARYAIDLVFFGVVLLACANILRSASGRAFISVRDSELSARCLGVNATSTKITAFALSAGITGLAGALMAQHLQFISPEAFELKESLRLLLMIVVGGMGTLLGPILGAAFVMVLPLVIREARNFMPASVADAPGIEPLVFGLVIVLFILFEPSGLAGRWVKIRRLIETFPYYRSDSFVRQKRYLKTERMR